MAEIEKIEMKKPFYFIGSYKENCLNSDIKIITPKKHLTILMQEKNINRRTKTLNRLYFNKINNINGNIEGKTGKNNIFPPLPNNNNLKKSVDLNNLKNDSQKYIINDDNNSYNNDKLRTFRIINNNKIMNEKNIEIKRKKKIVNIKTSGKEDCKTSNNFFSVKNKLLFSSLKVDVDSTKRNQEKLINILKVSTGKSSRFKNYTKSEDRKKYKKNIIITDNIKEDEDIEKRTKINDFGERCRQKRFSLIKKRFKLKYCVFPGNNSKLIDNVMKYRSEIWEKVPTSHYRFCDLVWSPLTSSIDFKSSQYVHQFLNHIQYNEEITNKMRLYANLLKHCEKKKIDVYKIFPFTICLTLSHHSFEEQLDNFKILFKEIDNYTPKSDVIFSSLFNALLNKKIGSSQTINIPKTFNSGKNMWIIKPVNLNRGRCIKILNNIDEILKEMKWIQASKKILISEGNNDIIKNKILNSEKKNSFEKEYINTNGIKCEYIMIQKYLEKPLLYQGRKFDIRMWIMLMTNRENEVYIFKEGHLKATSLKYNPDSNDLFVHLTNYSVQKHNIHFSKIEIGNEIPFYEFQRELDRKKTGINFKKDIYPKIVRIVRLTGGAAIQGKMNFMNVKNCFEIFGYDFILDENFKPYLLEINTNPGLEISSPLINQLLPRMIDDAFKLTIDDDFSVSSDFIKQESKFPVDYHSNNENLWDKYTIL
jgi:hypothetical protein